MSHDWYEVFDNEEVNYLTRRQAAHLGSVLTLGVVLTAAAFALAFAGVASMPLVLLALVVLWFGTVRLVMERLARLRRVVWCVKLSDRCIIGYDYARNRTRLDWIKVERVDLGKKALAVFSADGHVFEVSHLFPDFAALSHRVAHWADFYGVPIYVDGQPFEEVDVYDVFPFLAQATD